jgi:hypothetical protein
MSHKPDRWRGNQLLRFGPAAMKILLTAITGFSLLGTLAICATASEQAFLPAATIYSGPASITLPTSVLAPTPVAVAPEARFQSRPVRVVLNSPYAVRERAMFLVIALVAGNLAIAGTFSLVALASD